MTSLESSQVYGNPYLNPPDHPIEQEPEEDVCDCGGEIYDCGLCKECYEKWCK